MCFPCLLAGDSDDPTNALCNTALFCNSELLDVAGLCYMPIPDINIGQNMFRVCLRSTTEFYTG